MPGLTSARPSARERRTEPLARRDRRIQARLAAESDLEPLADLMRQELELQERLAGSFRLAPDVDWRRYASERCARQDAAVLVVEAGGAVVGFADLRIIGQFRPSRRDRLEALARRLVHPFGRSPLPLVEPRRRGFIDDIYVEPSARSAAAFFALSRKTIEWFRDQQVAEIEGVIWADNWLALRLAQRFDFKTTRVMVRKTL